MNISRNTYFYSLSLLILVCLGRFAFPQETQPASFKIELSMPKTTIKIDENIGIKITSVNLTDHPIQVGDGFNGGIEMELLDKTGKNFGPLISGTAFHDPYLLPSPGATPTTHTLIPKRNESLVWYVVFSSKHVSPGVYQLRIHNRELATGHEIYSNSVTINLVP